MDLEEPESVKLGHHIPIRRTDFSIDTLLRKDTHQRRPSIQPKLEVIPSFGDDDEMRLPCCTQIGSNYDSDQDPSTSSSPEPMNSILDGKDHPKYLGLTDEELTTFSWLSCTRFKPPKLPRSKKRSGCKRYGRGPRIPFAPHQIAVLESTFSKSQYLSSDCIHSLADTLHLSETRVKIWFQNRRARYRREKEASALAQSNGEEVPHFYTHHTSIASTSSLLPRHQNGDDIGAVQPLDMGKNMDKGNYYPMSKTSPTAEDLTNSKRKLLIPDFISQQLQHYRQVQEYILHQQEQMRYTSSSIGVSEISSPHSIQTKPLFSPASSILHSVLQSSPSSSTPLFPGSNFQSTHSNKGFSNSSESQIIGNSTSNRFVQFNNPYSPLSTTFPLQFR